MEKWKEYILTGNQLFHRECFVEAEMQYRYACQRALQLLTVWMDAEEAVAAIIVSYLNMADLCDRTNQSYLAMLEVEHVHALLQAAVDECDHDETRKSFLLQGLRKTRTILLEYQQKQYGVGNCSEPELSQGLGKEIGKEIGKEFNQELNESSKTGIKF